MNLEEILNRYTDSEQIKELTKLLSGDNKATEAEGDIHLFNLTGSMDAFVASAVFKSTEYNHFFILTDKEEAAYFQNNLKSILQQKDVFFFPDSFKRPQEFVE